MGNDILQNILFTFPLFQNIEIIQSISYHKGQNLLIAFTNELPPFFVQSPSDNF